MSQISSVICVYIQQALNRGLATKVVDDNMILKEANKMPNSLLQKFTYPFGWSKKLLTDSFNNSLESHLELEREGLSDCTNHSDGKEGIQAFIEKRKPTFG